MELLKNKILSFKKVDKDILVSFNYSTKLNSVNANEVKSEILQLINESEISIYLDLAEMKFIDSAGFQVLLTAYREAKLKDANFIICNANNEILDLFSAVGLNKVFDLRNKGFSFSNFKTAS
jgi:anti-anti-sigma factor